MDFQRAASAPLPTGHVRKRFIDHEPLREAARTGSLHAVLDACDAPSVLEKIDGLGKASATSLYVGSAAVNHRAQAPYLVKVDPPLLEWILDSQAMDPWGIFLQSNAEWNALRLHLRRFLHVRAPTQELWRFRFYDPRVLPPFLEQCTAEEAHEFLGIVQEYMVLHPREPGQATGFRLSGAAAAPRRRGIGEYFQLRPEHVGRLRTERITEALIESFRGTAQHASRSETHAAALQINDRRENILGIQLDAHGFIGSVTSPLGRTWRMENAPSGKLLRMSTPAGGSTRLSYHSNGRPETVSREDGVLLRAAYDEGGRLTRVGYPDGTGVSLDYRYSASEAAALAERPAAQLHRITNRSGHTESFTYDAHDALTSVTDGNGNTTRFDYETWDRPVRTIYADGSSESYEYGIDGRPCRIVSPTGSHLSLQYDLDGHVRHLLDSDGVESRFEYDARGRMVEARQGTHLVRYEYAPDGRIVAEEQDGGRVAWTHDEDGVLVSLTYPGGEVLRFERDEDLELLSITDWAGGRFDFRGSQDTRASATYLPNGLVEYSQTDAGGLPVRASLECPEKKRILYTVERTYDREDRLVGCSDSLTGTRHFDYDAEGQLIALRLAHQPWRNETFDYDAAGNRTTANGREATHNGLNQILREGEDVYQYDARGNMTRRANQTLKYDARNRLTEVSGLAGERVTFGYDALGRRSWKKVDAAGDPSSARKGAPSRLTRYSWAGEQLLCETTEAITPQGTRRLTRRDYLYHPDTRAPLAMRVDGTFYYYHNDHQGTPQRLTDRHGNIVWEAEYLAFGGVQPALQTLSQPLRMPGHYADEETGLYYNRFRYYDPQLGRYITRDPMGLLGGANLYAYCVNDPINQVDRFGLFSWRALAVGLVVAVAVAVVAVVAAPALIAAAGVAATSAAALAINAGVIVTAGAIAGAVTAGINSYLDNGQVCWPCVWKGAGVGALASLPFLAALGPAIAGLVGWKAIAAFSGLGFLSGNVAYFADMDQFRWLDYAATVGLSTVSAGALRAVSGPKTSRLPQDMAVNPATPRQLPLNRPIGSNPEQHTRLNADIQQALAEGATDVRVNQRQVNAQGECVGINRPDLQYTTADGQRVYIEYDTPASGRGPSHADRILANDPDAKVVLKIVPEDGTAIQTRTSPRPLTPVISTGDPPRESPGP